MISKVSSSDERRSPFRAPSDVFLDRLKGLLPAFGITRVANITGLDKVGIPVVSVSRPNSRALSVSQGKGCTLAEARISAIMESIESYHSENIFLPALNISLEDLSVRDSVIDIWGLPRNPNSHLDSSDRMLWIEGRNLLNGSKVWVPYDAVSTDFVSYDPTSPFIQDSNGLASGQTLLSAQLHGLCEIIERCALAKYACATDHVNRKIDLRSIDDPLSKYFLELLENAEIAIGIWDITTELNIPSFICRIMDRGENASANVRPAYGSASHTKKSEAIRRAILEAAQSRLTFISGLRDDQTKEIYNKFYEEGMLALWRNEITSAATSSFSDSCDVDKESPEEQLNYILSIFSNHGFEQVVSVDLTKAEFGIPVSKVLVPHMAGISALQMGNISG